MRLLGSSGDRSKRQGKRGQELLVIGVPLLNCLEYDTESTWVGVSSRDASNFTWAKRTVLEHQMLITGSVGYGHLFNYLREPFVQRIGQNKRHQT
jgi:hypothetical protein